MSHDAVARDVIGINIVLIIIAILSTQATSLLWQCALVGLAYGLACLLLLRFARQGSKAQRVDITEAEVIEEIPARRTSLPQDGNPA